MGSKAHGSGNQNSSSSGSTNEGTTDGGKGSANTEVTSQDGASTKGENHTPNGKNDPDFSLDGLDPKVQKYIKDLRKESAKHRTRATNLEGELTGLRGRVSKAFGDGEESWSDLAPEEQERRFEELGAGAEGLALENQVLKLAISNGISGEEALEFFQFKLQKQLSSMEEGEEMDEETITEIAAAVKQKYGQTAGNVSTSVTTGTGGKSAPNPDEAGSVSLDDFTSMSMAEKSSLYEKNRPLYDKLSAEAKKKRLLIK